MSIRFQLFLGHRAGEAAESRDDASAKAHFLPRFQEPNRGQTKIILWTSARVTLVLQAKVMQNLHGFMHRQCPGKGSCDIALGNACGTAHGVNEIRPKGAALYRLTQMACLPETQSGEDRLLSPLESSASRALRRACRHLLLRCLCLLTRRRRLPPPEPCLRAWTLFLSSMPRVLWKGGNS